MFVKFQNIFNKKRNVFNVLAFPSNQFGRQEPEVNIKTKMIIIIKIIILLLENI